jgi:predicted P-loop ATPase
MTEAPVKEVAAALNARIADLARALHGEPNRDLSSAQQLRFGTHGSLAVEIAGDNAGRWFDHEARQGGDGLEMVKQGRGLANGAALDWARQWLGWPPGHSRRRPRAPAMQPKASDLPSAPERATLGSEPISAPDHAPLLPDGVSLADPHSADLLPSDASPAGNDTTDGGAITSDQRNAKKAAEDAKRAAKVAEIIAGCEDPHGTCAETYLQRRGISASPLPSSIRYLPYAYGQYGALVALATDAAGEVHGLQQIYLTADGRKAPIKVQKRTNKAHDGWSDVSTVRMPGRAPIILCEGVETALSVWQATGQESWACLGISNIARAPLPDGAAVIIARDGDEPNSKADQQIRQAITILRGQGRDVTVAEPLPAMDFNDVLQSDGVDAVRMLIAATRPAAAFSNEWRKELLLNEDGEPRPVLANAITALRAAPEWQDVLWHDAFATTTVARKAPPWISGSTEWADTPWADRDDALVANWLQHQEIMVPMSIAGQAVEVVARDRLFHPVRDHLDALIWDGTPRLDTWLVRYLGAEETPYHRAIGPRWMISAVARIYIPGCKADCALILEGPQGIRKSSALMAIAKPWFADRLSDLSSKDAAMETRGVWIIEIAELDTMGRAEVSTIKAFMSRTQDRFRPPYGKRLVDLPRQCVFAGSVNPEGGYLKDPTGGRRFWPVVCGSIDISALEQDRDQLWAEARDRFCRKEPWWLETQSLDGLASDEQSERYQGDAWDDLIEAYLQNDIEWMQNGLGEHRAYPRPRPSPLQDVSVAEVLQHALAIEKGRWTQADQNRVVRSLVSMGFKQTRARKGGHGATAKRERRYRRQPAQEAPR